MNMGKGQGGKDSGGYNGGRASRDRDGRRTNERERRAAAGKRQQGGWMDKKCESGGERAGEILLLCNFTTCISNVLQCI